MPSRRRLLQLLVRFGVGGAVASRMPWLHAMGNRPPPPQGLYQVEGDVRVNGKRVGNGAPVQGGDEVRTGSDGKAIVVIKEDAFMMRPNTRFRVETGDQGGVKVLRLLTGGLLSVFKRGAGERQLVTPTSTIGIRGTAVYLELSPGRTYVCTCYGEADLQVNGYPDAQERVATRHHDKPRYLDVGPSGATISPAPVIHHTDVELDLLEGIFGRWPPFQQSKDSGGDKGHGY